ncbi:MAG: heme-binding protein [Candidatus Bathyarchaeota archaeon]|nr:heme-binding protein [Candidatus Bathyarchaeota archaeon]
MIVVQSVEYEIIKKLNSVEIRRYPTIVIAKVSNFEQDNFGLLFRFISGSNVQKENLKMTSPVVSQAVSQEIKMTSPVISEFSNQGFMAFVMPSKLTLETTPVPLDSRVKIEEIPARMVAVLRFRGNWSESHFEEKTKELLQELAKANIKTKGSVFTMLYNPPFTPSFLRRNEVAIEVEHTSDP